MCPCLRHASGVRELESISENNTPRGIAVLCIGRAIDVASKSGQWRDERGRSRVSCASRKNVEIASTAVTTLVPLPPARHSRRVRRRVNCIARTRATRKMNHGQSEDTIASFAYERARCFRRRWPPRHQRDDLRLPSAEVSSRDGNRVALFTAQFVIDIRAARHGDYESREIVPREICIRRSRAMRN